MTENHVEARDNVGTPRPKQGVRDGYITNHINTPNPQVTPKPETPVEPPVQEQEATPQPEQEAPQPEVQTPVEPAVPDQETAPESQQETALDQYKSGALSTLASLTDLPEEIRNTLAQEIKDAANQQSVDIVLRNAKEEQAAAIAEQTPPVEEGEEEETPDVETPTEEETPDTEAPVEDNNSTEDNSTTEQSPFTKAYADKQRLSADEFYRQAQTSENSTAGLYQENGRTVYGRYRLTQEEIDAVNNGEVFDFRKFNEHMLKLVNDLRASKNLNPLSYDPELIDGAKIRAREMASEGYTRPIDSKTGKNVVDKNGNERVHIRPESEGFRRWLTAFDDRLRAANGFGENIISGPAEANPYAILDEKSVAERLFLAWAGSPGHLENMLNKTWTRMYTHYNVGSRLRTGNKEETKFDGEFAGQWFRSDTDPNAATTAKEYWEKKGGFLNLTFEEFEKLWNNLGE